MRDLCIGFEKQVSKRLFFIKIQALFYNFVIQIVLVVRQLIKIRYVNFLTIPMRMNAIKNEENFLEYKIDVMSNYF